MPPDSLFRSGRLLLETVPSAGSVPSGAEETPLAVMVLVSGFVVLGILLLPRFLSLVPLLADSVLRARGSSALENSVRSNNDRNLIALVLLVPALLLVHRYRLYDPAFLRALDPSWRLAALAGVMGGWLLLRYLLYLWMRPRRRYDYYQMARRVGYTWFILGMLLVLVTVGILTLAGSPDWLVRLLLYGELGVVYLLFLLRRAQILSLSCNHLRTFLYLCGLEFAPLALLLVPAVAL